MSKRGYIRKILLFLILNFLIFGFIFLLFEFGVYVFESNRYSHLPYSQENKFRFLPYSLKIDSFDSFYNALKTDPNYSFRKPIGLEYKKKPVILFGCSYAWGVGLNLNQTFGSKLSKLSNRPVYNRSFIAWSVQHMLYQLRKEPDLDKIKNPEFIIYTFFSDQLNRLNTFSFHPTSDIFYLKYKEENGKLIEDYPISPFLYKFYLTRCLSRNIWSNKVQNPELWNENFDLLKLLFEQSKEITDKKYPNSKFVILIYNESPGYWYIETDRWKELEKEGFIVLDTNKITKSDLSLDKYKLEDGHPNEAAWNLIVPALVKKLNM